LNGVIAVASINEFEGGSLDGIIASSAEGFEAGGATRFSGCGANGVVAILAIEGGVAGIGEGVIAGAAIDGVDTGATFHGVVALVAGEVVVTVAAKDGVVAEAAGDGVVAAEARESVVTGEAADLIVA
jgi:hypothetical protein